MVVLEDERKLEIKIEIVKELLYKKIKENIVSEDFEEINKILNKLIIN